MERFFMSRASAVTFLLESRRAMFAKISDSAFGDVETESRELEEIDRLILDVRAGRVCVFQLKQPRAVEIFVTA
jgi:hypothetical protein